MGFWQELLWLSNIWILGFGLKGILIKKIYIYGGHHYQDICTDKYVANIAYRRSNIAVNNTFVENVAGPTGHGDFVGMWSSIPFSEEITLPFLEKFNIIATLIDCNYSMSLLDEETGEWGGVVGQVNICFVIILGL